MAISSAIAASAEVSMPPELRSLRGNLWHTVTVYGVLSHAPPDCGGCVVVPGRESRHHKKRQ